VKEHQQVFAPGGIRLPSNGVLHCADFDRLWLLRLAWALCGDSMVWQRRASWGKIGIFGALALTVHLSAGRLEERIKRALIDWK